ncbi:FxSxx-COOH system tetratricopeptide repeat protein [Streptomyces griseoaurantiacus]|jgi:cellulose biosynthesis protein BcsQ|uniref:ATP/GTP-binding protein n=1 Tax=Streptomyces griseoaurantiacus M045 TaxID=996637 RepID=F3NGR4_9ACTN|nr:FxSxx-COOH system tetratricopeptide repeat protein [Streptomyces griseoaurantiacus]EGG47404.1 ATP/GTP-binding protein [Streptomyces griseoaurantiacus M045]
MKYDSGDAGTAESGTIVTFYSFKGGTGRTMSLANVAWILASNGKRVLVMDWDLEAPGLHRYFTPFLGDPDLASTEGLIDLVRKFELRVPRTADEDLREYARVERYATTLTTTFPDGGYIDFVSSGKQTPEYSEAINTYDWRGFYERRDGAAFLEALREDMRRNYDYVLVDSRTGFGDTSGITTMMLPDVLVNCFTLNTQSVDGGADIARDVKRGAPHVKIIPVPMRVDYAEQEKLEASRDHARRRFQEFLKDTPRAADPDSYWGAVEIPYRSYFAYEEVLATVADTPRQPASLLAAYERLTSVVTDGAITTLQAPDEQTRKQMLARFQRVRTPGGGLAPRVRLDFAVRDGAWAEWLAAQMQAAGIAVTLRASSPSVPLAVRPADSADVVIALLSPDFATTPVADEVRALATALERPRIIGLRTREYTPEPALRGLPGFVLVDLPATQALSQVFGLLELDPPAAVAPEGPAYPGLVPRAFHVPPRNNTFTGRDVLLDRLRTELGAEALRQDTPVSRVFLYGLGGIGKTQIAQEYVHRYGSQYDVVHWIPAEQPETIPQLLSELGTELGLRGESVDDLVQATLAALRTGLAGRWLLVFDNIESRGSEQSDSTVEQYIPADGPGHVIVTARRSPMGQNQSSMEIDAFNRPESIALLRRRVDGLSTSEANRIADTLGDFPMAMEIAAAWLRQTAMPLDTYLDLVNSRVSAVLSREGIAGEGPQQSLTAVWRLSVDRLDQDRPAAVRLLEMCSFLSPEPIAHSLLYSDGMRNYLAEVTGDSSVFDPMVMGYLIRDLGRYALATVDQRKRYIQVHRLLQAAVREWLAENPARMDRIRHHAQLILAGALPSAALPEEGQQARQRMAELLPHLEPSQAIHSTDPRVCEWVIRQVRNQWLIGDHRAAAALGRRALAVWGDSLGRDHSQTLRLAAQVANPLRSLGRFENAYDLDADTLRRQQEQLGEDHAYTLVTARNYGGDLRGLGRYKDAYESDQRTYDLARENPDLGEDNEATLRAGNNLGVSLNLAGRPAEALALASETYERCRSVLGRDHRFTWGVASNVALDLREMGHYQRSLDLLTEIRRELVRLQQEDSNAVLRADASLAITQRRLGNYSAAEALTRTTLNAYHQRYGEAHPETMSCGANLACDLLALSETQPDRLAEAAELGKSNLEVYREQLGADHPFTLAAATNLVAILRNQGEATEALKLADETLRQLLERLGETHPATVACRANRAGALSGLARHRDALAEDEKVHEAYRALYGPDHPRVLCAQYNMALERNLAGDEEAEATLREAMSDTERKLGPRHPTCRTMVSRRRIDFDLEMPPT